MGAQTAESQRSRSACTGFQGLSFQTIVGWLLTIAAISLGAPFWFDLVSKVPHFRASGTKEANRAKDR